MDAVALRAFDCRDADLNDFIRNDAARLQVEAVTQVYLACYLGDVVGYIALLNDAVELKSPERKKLGLGHADSKTIPALKIGRLAVSYDFRLNHCGVGTQLIGFAYAKAVVIAQSAGCRLLTVDAYNQDSVDSVAFYRRLGFIANKNQDQEELDRPPPPVQESLPTLADVVQHRRTLSMRFDLHADPLPDWAK